VRLTDGRQTEGLQTAYCVCTQ